MHDDAEKHPFRDVSHGSSLPRRRRPSTVGVRAQTPQKIILPLVEPLLAFHHILPTNELAAWLS